MRCWRCGSAARGRPKSRQGSDRPSPSASGSSACSAIRCSIHRHLRLYRGGRRSADERRAAGAQGGERRRCDGDALHAGLDRRQSRPGGRRSVGDGASEFPVVDAFGKPAGLLTREDILNAVREHGHDEPAATFMRSDVERVRPSTPVESLFERLQDRSAAALYVTDADGQDHRPFDAPGAGRGDDDPRRATRLAVRPQGVRPAENRGRLARADACCDATPEAGASACNCRLDHAAQLPAISAGASQSRKTEQQHRPGFDGSGTVGGDRRRASTDRSESAAPPALPRCGPISLDSEYVLQGDHPSEEWV